jgi:hypothetical protein
VVGGYFARHRGVVGRWWRAISTTAVAIVDNREGPQGGAAVRCGDGDAASTTLTDELQSESESEVDATHDG